METQQLEWLNPIQLLEYISISIKTQNRLRSEGKIPYCKVGRQVRYNRHEIDKWLTDHKVA